MAAGKDCMIRYWDCDKFEQLFALKVHHDKMWVLTISHSCDLIISAGYDGSIRSWKKVNSDKNFLNDKKLFDNKRKSLDNYDTNFSQPAKNSNFVLDYIERLKYLLNCGTENDLKNENIKNYHIWKILSTIDSCKHIESLHLLPFSSKICLLKYLPGWLSYPKRIETTGKISILLINSFLTQPSLSNDNKKRIRHLHETLESSLKSLTYILKYNTTAIKQIICPKS